VREEGGTGFNRNIGKRLAWRKMVHDVQELVGTP